jgi:hypothetical protein
MTTTTNRSVAKTYAKHILPSKVGVRKGVSGFALIAKHDGGELEPDGGKQGCCRWENLWLHHR